MFGSLFVSACLLVAVSAAGIELGSVLEQQHGSMQMLLDVYGNRRARAATSRAAADQCFGNYMSQESNVVTIYNKAFIGCSNDSESMKKDLLEEHMKYRVDLLKRGDDICLQMDACKLPNDTVEFFNCYHAAAGNNTQNLYTISMEADTHSTNLQTQLAQLESDYKVCVGKAHNKYLSDIFASNKQLQACLSGKSIDVPQLPAEPSVNTKVSTPIAPIMSTLQTFPNEDLQ